MTALALSVLLAQAAPADPYHLQLGLDVPVASAAVVLFAGALVEAQLRQPTPCPCDTANILGFDRIALGRSSPTADTLSTILAVTLAIAAPAGAIAGAGLASPGGWSQAGEAAAIQGESMALNIAVNELVKSAVARPRPFVYPLSNAPANDYVSFYSEHTSISFNAVTTATYLLHESYPHEAWPWIAGASGLAVAALIGGLRVVAGQHFPSDVVVGAAVGAGIGFLVPFAHDKLGIEQPAHPW